GRTPPGRGRDGARLRGFRTEAREAAGAPGRAPAAGVLGPPPRGTGPHTREKMDRNLALEVVRVTEAAAIASARHMGRGDEKACDQAAVDAMRRAFDNLRINGTVVIGEGERDEAP